MMRRSFASIRARLAMLVVLAVLPAFVLVGYQAWEEQQHEAGAALEKALLVTRLVSSQQDHLAAGARQLLIALAQLPQVRPEDATTCNLLFSHLLDKYQQYANLGATTPEGVVFCSAIPFRDAVQLSDRPWFQQAMHTRDFAVGRYQIGRLTGKPSLIFALPVFEPAGEIRAVVYAALDLAWLNQIVASTHLPAGASITVIDRKGIILARHPDSEKWVGRVAPEVSIDRAILAGGEGTARTIGADGLDRLVAFTPLGRAGAGGASVTVGIPAEYAFGRVRHVLIHHLAGLLLAAAVTLALALAGGALFLTRPLRTLAVTARRLQRGELAARTGLPHDAGELGDLTQVFDEMAEALEDQARARDRTAQALQESERRYRELTDTLPQTVFECDLEGRLLFANRTAFEMFGYTPEELARGLNVFQMLPPEEHQRAAETIRRFARESGIIGEEYTAVRRDGCRFPAMVYAARIVQGESAIGVRGILVDITDREKMEDALRARTHQLEAVRHVSMEIARELDPTVLLTLIFRRALDLVGASGGSLYLWEELRQHLVPTVWHGIPDSIGALSLRLGEGLAGAVAERQAGMVVDDYQTSPFAHRRFVESTDITVAMAEPLRYRDRLVGVIVLNKQGIDRPFHETDRELLGLFADQAVIAIENARLFAATEHAAREARSLYEIAHSLTTSLDVGEVLQLVAMKTRELLGTPHAQVVLWDEAPQSLRLGAASGTQAEEVKDQAFRLGVGVNGVVAETRAPLVVNDYQAWPYRVPGMAELVAVIGVPLLYRNRLLGVLTTHTTVPGAGFTDGHLALLISFADQAAVAIENARLYEELRLAAAQLEARVKERTQELAQANQRLEAASRHKSEFLTNMSHELRTPLNSILGFSQFLLEQSPEALSAKQRRFLTHIHTSGEHLLQLINDILDLSKVEAGKLGLRPEPLGLPRILEETLAMIRPLAHKKEIRLTSETEADLPRVSADPLRIKQILFNLLGNAVKFTPERGQINVHIGRVAGTGRVGDDGAARDWLAVRVADTGIGITAEDMPRLFQDFVQLDSAATRRQGGTGLGLALTKRLVELHGGRIWAESDGPGRGACFVVQVPIVEAPIPTILVVDDDLPLLRLLCVILRDAGYAVESAKDASEAIAAFAATVPALVVLDVGLPPDNEGGWRVLEHIRTGAASRMTPVLILTGQHQLRPEDALARGANDFLGKPVSPQVLLDTVARLLRQSTSSPALPDARANVEG